MIVDSSALMALLLREEGWERIAAALSACERPAVGAPTLTETSVVLRAKGVSPFVLDALIRRAGIEVIAFSEQHAVLASDAYGRYGRGRHRASLNFGDCMTYATAQLAGAPLLFVGDDFRHTDLQSAL